MKKLGIGILVMLVITVISFQIFSARFVPILQSVAEKEVGRFCQLVVNHCSFPYINISDEIIRIERDDTNQISLIDFNMSLISQTAGKLVLEIEELLLALEEGIYVGEEDSIYRRKLQKINDSGGIIASVPIGAVSKNPFIAGTGPKVSIKYQTISQVSSSIVKEVKNYGINRMMVGISIVVTIKLMIVAPFYKEEYTQDITFPLSLEIIEGQVPQWYQN